MGTTQIKFLALATLALETLIAEHALIIMSNIKIIGNGASEQTTFIISERESDTHFLALQRIQLTAMTILCFAQAANLGISFIKVPALKIAIHRARGVWW